MVKYFFLSKENNFISKPELISEIYQSDITHLYVQQLLDTQNCDLTPYEESVKHHIPLLKVFLNHYNTVNKTKIKFCPIT